MPVTISLKDLEALSPLDEKFRGESQEFLKLRCSAYHFYAYEIPDKNHISVTTKQLEEFKKILKDDKNHTSLYSQINAVYQYAKTATYHHVYLCAEEPK